MEGKATISARPGAALGLPAAPFARASNGLASKHGIGIPPPLAHPPRRSNGSPASLKRNRPPRTFLITDGALAKIDSRRTAG
jgi:hypothetical protein